MTFLGVRKFPSDSAARGAEAPRPEAAGSKIGRRSLSAVVMVVLVIAGAAALVSAVPAPSGVTTGSISISSGADAIVASAVQAHPAGFTLESSKQPPSVGSDWAVLQQKSDGSEANVTVLVYLSANASQAYFSRLVGGLRGLPGYADITSNLAPFQRYGSCYGYGEDVDNIAVVNGVCTKGNVFLQVHLVSSIAPSSLEGDLASIMGALYQSAA